VDSGSERVSPGILNFIHDAGLPPSPAQFLTNLLGSVHLLKVWQCHPCQSKKANSRACAYPLRALRDLRVRQEIALDQNFGTAWDVPWDGCDLQNLQCLPALGRRYGSSTPCHPPSALLRCSLAAERDSREISYFSFQFSAFTFLLSHLLWVQVQYIGNTNGSEHG
jgi:hypothetical protein